MLIIMTGIILNNFILILFVLPTKDVIHFLEYQTFLYIFSKTHQINSKLYESYFYKFKFCFSANELKFVFINTFQNLIL